MKFWAFERRWLCAVLAAVLPFDDATEPALADAKRHMARFVDALVVEAPAYFTFGLRACTWLLMLSPPLVLGRMCSFTALTAAEGSLVLEKMSASRFYLVRNRQINE